MRAGEFLLLILGVALVGMGCAAVGGPSGSGVSLASMNEADLGAYQRGRALASTECTQCHRLYRPQEFSLEDWPNIIRKMGSRSSFNRAQTEDVIFYYTAGASPKAQ